MTQNELPSFLLLDINKTKKNVQDILKWIYSFQLHSLHLTKVIYIIYMVGYFIGNKTKTDKIRD